MRIRGSRLLQGWHEANRLELVWLAKAESTEEHLCDDEHGVRELQRSNDSPNQPVGDKNLPTSRRLITPTSSRRGDCCR